MRSGSFQGTLANATSTHISLRPRLVLKPKYIDTIIECIRKHFFSQKKCLFVCFGGANERRFWKKMFVSKRRLLINPKTNILFSRRNVCFLAETQSRGVLPQGGEELGKCYCRSLRMGRGAYIASSNININYTELAIQIHHYININYYYLIKLYIIH